MRIVAIVAVLAGCSQPPMAADAGSDAEPPDASEVGLGDGDYALQWECLEGCAASLPAATWDRLTVSGDQLGYWYQECPSCIELDEVTARDPDCISGAGIPQGDTEPTEPYTLCALGGAIEGTIGYTGRPGPADLERTWLVRAHPL